MWGMRGRRVREQVGQEALEARKHVGHKST